MWPNPHLRISSQLLEKYLMENFIFCVVSHPEMWKQSVRIIYKGVQIIITDYSSGWLCFINRSNKEYWPMSDSTTNQRVIFRNIFKQSYSKYLRKNSEPVQFITDVFFKSLNRKHSRYQ